MAVSNPGERWTHELGLADVLLLADKDVEANSILEELERIVPAEQVLARCRIADLRGDVDALKERVAALDDEQRVAWDKAQAERRRG